MKKQFISILLLILSVDIIPAYPEIKGVTDPEFISERIKPPLSITFSAGMASASSFTREAQSINREKLIQENLILKARLNKEWNNAESVIALAKNNAALGNINDANIFYTEAEKILSNRISDNSGEVSDMVLLADLYMDIININIHDLSLFRKYTEESLKLNSSIISRTDKTGEKTAAYKRMGIVSFLSGNFEAARMYISTAAQNGGEDFELFFTSEIIKIFMFMSELTDLKTEKIFIETPVISVYNFSSIQKKIKEHPDDSRYSSFLNYIYLWMLFIKCGISDSASFLDINNKTLPLSPDDSSLLYSVEKYFLIQKTNGTVTEHDINIFLAMINFIKRDIKNSVAYYNSAFNVQPLDRQCMSVLIFLYSKTDDYGNAIKTIQKKMSVLEEASDYVWLSSLYLMSGEKAMAEKAAKKSISMKSDEPDAHFVMGMVYLSMNKMKEASDELDFVRAHTEADWPYSQELQIATASLKISEGKRMEAFGLIKGIWESNADGNLKQRAREILKQVFLEESRHAGINP